VLFHNVQKGFIVQTGDPTGTGKGGSSVYGCADCAFAMPLPPSPWAAQDAWHIDFLRCLRRLSFVCHTHLHGEHTLHRNNKVGVEMFHKLQCFPMNLFRHRVMYGDQARLFEDEIHPHLKHKRKGLVAMAGGAKDANASQFYITTGAELDSLDEKHTIFGEARLLQAL